MHISFPLITPFLKDKDHTMSEREIVNAIKAACEKDCDFLDVCADIAERFGVEQRYVEKLYDEIDCGEWDEEDEE